MAAPRGNKNHLRHGMAGTRLHHIWKTMKQRCYNPNTANYKNYGGRGIEVCEEWKNSFENFYSWAIKSGYTDDLTIDRVKVDEGYNPSNCRWSTYKEQSNNKTNSRVIEFNGETRTLAEWSDKTGIKNATIWARLKSGWSVEDALTIIPIVGRNQYHFN